MHKDLHDLLEMQNEPGASIEKLEVTRAPGQQERPSGSRRIVAPILVELSGRSARTAAAEDA